MENFYYYLILVELKKNIFDNSAHYLFEKKLDKLIYQERHILERQIWLRFHYLKEVIF